jgi:two-component system sensor histidine kinase RegB
MGLGVFIAQTLLERTGAMLSFGNRRRGGAEVIVSWPRDVLETGEGEARSARP